jgi:hypothetical protein
LNCYQHQVQISHSSTRARKTHRPLPPPNKPNKKHNKNRAHKKHLKNITQNIMKVNHAKKPIDRRENQHPPNAPQDGNLTNKKKKVANPPKKTSETQYLPILRNSAHYYSTGTTCQTKETRYSKHQTKTNKKLPTQPMLHPLHVSPNQKP